MSPLERMAESDRDYLTPEDITAAIEAGCSKEIVQHETLVMLGKKACEDWSLCAFLAWHGFAERGCGK